MRRRRTRSRLRRLLPALGDARFPAVSRDLLADALGDPSLEVGFWVPEVNGYVDSNGSSIELPTDDSDRSASFVADADGSLGVLIHERRLRGDARLANATAAAGLGLRNARLQAELRVQLAEVEESRARLVHAADLERARLERAVRAGAERELLRLTQTLRAASATLPSEECEIGGLVADAIQLAEATRDELQDLARGILPRVLMRDGLPSALQALVERAGVEVELGVAPLERLPLSIEVAAYFACSEAVTNIAKHACASRATVQVLLIDGELIVEVTDDGDGGASIRRGGGLAGVADRIEALGGTMEVLSPPRGGTRVLLRIPARS